MSAEYQRPPRRAMKNYTLPPRKPEMMDETMRRAENETDLPEVKRAKSPKPEGRSRMKLRSENPVGGLNLQRT